MRKQKVMGTFTLAFLGTLLFSVTSLADWEVKKETINILTLSSYKTEIVEEYQVPDHVDPGTVVDKTVNVKNTGNVDTFVRVRVDKTFGVRDQSGKLIVDTHLDPELILIDYKEDYWKLIDGYWYYREVLPAGEMTKQPLFETYRLSERAGNAYKGKDAEITVHMESIQAEAEALSEWSVSKQSLGISYEDSWEKQITTVTFAGKENGFSVSNQNDLFANFKNLVPGDERIQQVQICNSSAESVYISLCAETVSQDKMSQSQLAAVEKLLAQYAVIELKNGDTLLYQGSIDGKKGRNGQTMFQELNLGEFEKNEKKELTIRLNLDPSMENEFQKLSGKVKWVLTAHGEDQKNNQDMGTPSSIIPKTGDETELLAVIEMIGVSILLFAAGILLLKKDSILKNRRR